MASRSILPQRFFSMVLLGKKGLLRKEAGKEQGLYGFIIVMNKKMLVVGISAIKSSPKLPSRYILQL